MSPFFLQKPPFFLQMSPFFLQKSPLFLQMSPFFFTKYLFDLRKINDGFCKENGDKNFVKIMVTT